MEPFYFLTSCEQWHNGDDINEMKAQAETITRYTYLKRVDVESRKEIEKQLGYDHYFPMSKDWHVSYYKSYFVGKPVYYFTWSGIEHIFMRYNDIRKVR